MDRSADSVRSDAPPAPNCEGCESARAPTATDRFVFMGCPDRLVDAKLEEDVPLRIVLPYARGRDEGRIVYPRRQFRSQALEVLPAQAWFGLSGARGRGLARSAAQ